MDRIAIIMTCFNRQEKTKKCLDSIGIESSNNEDIQIDVYLTNDGCTDGTDKMVKKYFPKVNILQGDGSLFWNKGMYQAFKAAEKKDYDFYLWVNDDVEFDPNIVSKLVDYFYKVKKKEETIIVGYTENKERTAVTYAGFKNKKSIIPLSTKSVMPSTVPVKIDTFHGNCVLISRAVVKRIGIIDPFYSHGIGDSDYGHTATRNKCDIWLTTFSVGVCEKNIIYSKLYDENLSLKERFKFATSRKQRPVKDWWHFSIKNGGPLGIIRFTMAYAKIPFIHLKIRYLKRVFNRND